MNIFRPKFRRVILFSILAIVCFVITISVNFIPAIANIFAAGVFVFTVLSILTLILFILTRPWHFLIKVVLVPIILMFGSGIAFFALVFSGFTVRSAEKFDYKQETYYYRNESSTYTLYNLYKRTGLVTMTKVEGLSSKELQEEQSVESLKQIIDELDRLKME